MKAYPVVEEPGTTAMGATPAEALRLAVVPAASWCAPVTIGTASDGSAMMVATAADLWCRQCQSGATDRLP